MDDKQQIWEHYHYRFGLAGEGQADIIQTYLDCDPGRVLDIGCGPWGKCARNLALHSGIFIAAAKSLGAGLLIDDPANIRLLMTDARCLCLADESIDHIVALGLFAEVPEIETAQVFAEFYRVCRVSGELILTNSVRLRREFYCELGRRQGFHLLEEHEGYWPAVTGDIKGRYLLVFVKKLH